MFGVKFSRMKLKLPQFKKPSGADVSIGLDIGRGYVKLVFLRKENGSVFLDNFCVHPVAGDVPSLLNRIFKECNPSVNRVNISLSGKSTIVRDLWLSKMNPKELKVSLGYELDQYIPFPVEDVYFDSYVLEENSLTRKEGQMRVVLAVANKKYVNERLQWLKTAGLVPNAIDMDAISLFNLYELEIDGTAVIGLVDIGASKTIIDIASSGVLMFTREIEYGTARARDGAVNGLSITAEDAEKLVCENSTKITAWTHDLIGKLSKELWNSFDYYESQEQKPVEKVYVTGGGSLLSGLSDLLSQALGIPVVVLRPVDKIKVNLDEIKKKEFEKISPMFSIAAGLALKTL